jgi:serine/threonine-protein kinase
MVFEGGESVGGYRIERLLGRGGMGVVYEAVQSTLDRRIALKLLNPELAEDPAFVARFRREAQLQASLEHPHVLDVYEVGEVASGELFIAMQLVRGDSLAGIIRGRELDASRALHLLEQVGDALDAAHDAGLLHRDVKPQNALVEAEGERAYLSDFGLSRARSDSVTASRPTVGTVAYMAPEVIRGEDAQPASDRYSFAATLFHCLTGDVPFARSSDAAVLFAHVSEPPPRISGRRPELPASLDEIFEGALAKDPGARPSSARELVADVRRALGDHAAEIGPPRPRSRADSDETEALPAIPPPHGAGGRGRRRLAALAAGAGILVALAAAALIGWADDDSPAPPLPAGAEAIGSDLPAPDASLGCRGEEDGGGRKPCAILQAELPGGVTLAPADGVVKGWAVRGASGEMALEVIRLRGKDTVRVNRSQWEAVGNSGVHEFESELPVERGDAVGLVLAAGSRVGVVENSGASTLRWIDPADGFYGEPDEAAGTGFDYELALRAEFVAGETIDEPETLTGADAARAPRGEVRKSATVEFSEPPVEVSVDLVETQDRVALDVRQGGRRTARTYIPDLLPGGQPVALEVLPAEGRDGYGAAVWWVNRNSGRLIFHFFSGTEERLDYVG